MSGFLTIRSVVGAQKNYCKKFAGTFSDTVNKKASSRSPSLENSFVNGVWNCARGDFSDAVRVRVIPVDNQRKMRSFTNSGTLRLCTLLSTYLLILTKIAMLFSGR